MNTLRCILLALALLPAASLAIDGYRQHAFRLPATSSQMLVADANGDGLRELLVADEHQLRIYFQDSGYFDFETGFVTIEFPGDAIGWDLSHGYPSGDQALSIVALVDGREVMLWQVAEGRVSEPVVLMSGLSGFLAKGLNRLHFSRDVNDDGLDDLIVPGAGILTLYIRNAGGDYQTGIPVQTDMVIQTSLAPGSLERQVGQSTVIPMMELRDINGDGASDLVARTDEQLDVFLAARTGSQYFPLSPTYSVDIAAIEERLGEFDIDRLDFSNLTGILALTHEEILEDVDADGIDDLLLREGGKVSLFAGHGAGMDLDQPRQVLRSGGNVLSIFLFDENEDGLKDLWLWRVETISVGDLFLWLALSGSIAVEAFIYPNEGDSFARRPSRKITVDLKFPSALRLASSAMEIAREAREAGAQPLPPNATAELDGDPGRQDLLVLMDNQLRVFLNAVEPVTRSDPFLDGLGYARNRDNYEIDIRDIIDNVSVDGSAELDGVRNVNPEFEVAVDGEIGSGDIIPIELNGDGRDDIFVFTGRDDVQISGLLLLSVPR